MSGVLKVDIVVHLILLILQQAIVSFEKKGKNVYKNLVQKQCAHRPHHIK